MHIEPLSLFSRVVAWVVLFCFCTTQVVRADEIVYFHNDAAGTPQVATDVSGSVLWREHYRPYGSRLDNPAAASNNTVWYTGKPQDASTGLSYFGARYYDPTLGRFSSVDPAPFDEQDLHALNRYAYANNNPYGYVDPDGRNPLALFAAVAVVLIAIVIIGGSNPPDQNRSRDLARRTDDFGAQLARDTGRMLTEKKDDNPTEPPIETDETGKVHGSPLPEAEDIPDEELDNAIDALDDSIGVREEEQEEARERGQNTSSDRTERMKYRKHQDRINDEKRLKAELERKRDGLPDRERNQN